ncbi:MAG: molybdopterin-synthase adenylyltransferase MoeB [Saprospiraceae bacterium]|nr:molybdopterin-synthase adenylyltransferase MoeB [Saprospiraceae bacterium]MDZ4706573.1 molybdopterin-synthase adenylyltransferase MoeB [Saprospiraceae bacterium]
MPYQDIQFSTAELNRYQRHLSIPGFGLEGQQKLKAAKVLVIGAGGLGSPLLMYLAAAGVGHIGIADFDVVEDSNLQRQVLFGEADLGILKVEAAKRRLEALNPHIRILLHPEKLSAQNALNILKDYDLVADGSDNFPTRYLVNDACVLLGKTNVYAAVSRFEGQVSVFNYPDPQGNFGSNYRDLHPVPPPPGLVPDCAEGGVLGVLPGIIGSLQALEVVKVITGLGQVLHDRIFIFDGLHFETRIFKIRKRADNPLNGENPTISQLIDYEEFCMMQSPGKPVRELSAAEFLQWQASGETFQLIDVREPEEYAAANIGGELIPLSAILKSEHQISRELKVVVHCKSGSRSAKAIRDLEKEFGFENLYTLKGGIEAYLQLDRHSPVDFTR